MVVRNLAKLKENNQLNREKIGRNASIVGIFANMILSAGKIFTGILFGYLSILADGLNNISDCINNIVSIISFKLSSKPADSEHPYGHERIEYISSMVVSFIILVVAYELLKESISKIITPVIVEFSIIAVCVLIFSVIVKAFMYFYYKTTAKKIDSELLKSLSIDSLSDCIATSAVLISIVISKITNFSLDGYAGIIVAMFITYSAYGILKETISKLIGQAPDAQFIKDIKYRILKREEVLGIHELNIYSYGPNKYFASVHIEVDSNTDILISHELIDEIEREFLNETNIVLTGHLDPVITNNEEINTLKNKISEHLKSNDIKNFLIYDFRVVKQANFTNVIFEIALPFDFKKSEKDIILSLKTLISNINNEYKPIIMIKRQNF